MKKKELSRQSRMVGLDVLRIIFCGVVVAFHFSHYRVGGAWINTVMLFFFLLSGFSLEYVYHDHPVLDNADSLRRFYIKRFASLMPLYILVEIFRVAVAGEDFSFRLALLPLRLFGLQTSFKSVNIYVGVTWFNSCIILAYLVFPLFNKIVSLTSTKTRAKMLLGLLVLYLYIHFVSLDFDAKIYYNVVVRVMEFGIGVIFASIIYDEYSSFRMSNIMTIPLSLLLLFGLTVNFGNKYLNLIKIPMTLALLGNTALISLGSGSPGNFLVRVIGALSALTLDVYMLQDVILSKSLKPYWEMIPNEDERILAMTLVLLGLSVLTHLIIVVPMKKLILKIAKLK